MLPGPLEQKTWTLLCVDDESGILSALQRLFRRTGYRVLIASSGAEGIQILERQSVDLVISDMRMPTMDGACFLKQVQKRWPHIVRILLTGYASPRSMEEVLREGGIFCCIDKPWDGEELLSQVRKAIQATGGAATSQTAAQSRHAMEETE